MLTTVNRTRRLLKQMYQAGPVRPELGEETGSTGHDRCDEGGIERVSVGKHSEMDLFPVTPTQYWTQRTLVHT